MNYSFFPLVPDTLTPYNSSYPIWAIVHALNEPGYQNQPANQPTSFLNQHSGRERLLNMPLVHLHPTPSPKCSPRGASFHFKVHHPIYPTKSRQELPDLVTDELHTLQKRANPHFAPINPIYAVFVMSISVLLLPSFLPGFMCVTPNPLIRILNAVTMLIGSCGIGSATNVAQSRNRLRQGLLRSKSFAARCRRA